MSNFLQSSHRRRLAVVAVFFMVFLSSCAGLRQEPASLISPVESGAKPEQAWSPEPIPARSVNSNAPGITKIVVPSKKTIRNAIYRSSQPQLQVSMPDFEIPVTGASGRKKAVWFPGPVEIEKTGMADPEPLSWTTTDTGFVSFDFDDNGTDTGGFRFIPPDSHAAAGPSHVVNVVNTGITFHQKDGTIDYQNSLKNFFSSLTPLTFTFDPKVLYDQYEGRWVVITMEQTDNPDTSRMFVAVSDDSDPNGTWYISEFDTVVGSGNNKSWADYPGFAVDEEAVYITANLFRFSNGNYDSSRVWVLNKQVGAGGFYDGGPLALSELNPYASVGIATTSQPSHMYGIAPAGLGVFLVSFSGISDGTNEYIQVVRLDNPLSAPAFTQTYISMGDIDGLVGDLPGMPQFGTGTLIESNDRRALDAVWRNNALWLTTTINPNFGTDSGEATALWVKIDTTSLANLSIADIGTIGGEEIASGTYTTFPSIAVNASEDVVVGFSASADSTYAGAYFVDRQASDPAGVMGAPVVVKAGVDYYFRAFGGSRNRWGDYSATAVDPVNGCFWVYNQWADIRGTIFPSNPTEDGRWGTAYAKTCSTVCNATLYIDAGEWTRFALPCSVTANTVGDIFGGLNPDDLDLADYADTWGVFSRDASVPKYNLLDIGAPLLDGVGYWVFSPTTTQVNVNGSPATVNDIDLVGVAEGRDNYIGHNQNVSVAWDQVQVVDGGNVLIYGAYDSVMSRVMNKWTGVAYQMFDGITSGMLGTLEPFDAFWVQAFKPGIKLRIPVGAPLLGATPIAATVESFSSIEGSDGDKARKPKKPKKPKNEPWHIRLIASAGDNEDPGNVLGQLDTATEGNDRHDLEEPAPFGNQYLSILFTNPLFEQVDWGFTSDFRATTKNPQGVWPFVVKAHAGISEVTISWQGEDHLFKDAWLIDEHSGEMVKAVTGESYTFKIEDGEHHFRFEVGDD